MELPSEDSEVDLYFARKRKGAKMINCYCSICGLYIVVDDKYIGGKGACQRCKNNLRIPKPIPPTSKKYVGGLRYLAHVATEKVPAEPAEHIGFSYGPSTRYRCNSCGKFFQSIHIADNQDQCPFCNGTGSIETPDVQFTRQLRNRKTPKNDPQPQALEDINDLQRPVDADAGGLADTINSEYQEQIDELKSKADELSALLAEKTEQVETLTAELEANKNDPENSDQQVIEDQKSQAELEEKNAQIEQLTADFEQNQTELATAQEQVNLLTDQIQTLENSISAGQQDQNSQAQQQAETVANLENENKSLTEQVANLTSQLEAVKQDLDQQIEKLQTQKADFDQRLQSNEDELAKSNHELAEQVENLADENSKLLVEVQDLTANLDEKTQQAEMFENQIAQEKQQFAEGSADLNEKLEKANQQAEELKSQVENLEIDLETARMEVSEKSAELDEKSTELQQANENLADQTQQSQSQIDQLSEDLDTLNNQVAQLNDQLEAKQLLEAELTENNQQEIQLREENIAQLNEEIDQLNQQIQSQADQQKTQTEALQQSVENLTADLQRTQDENSQQVEAIDELNSEKIEFESKISTLKMELEQAQSQQELLQTQHSEARQQLEDQIADLEQKLEQSTKRVSEITSELAENEGFGQALEKAQAEISDLQEENKKLRDEIRIETQARQGAELVAEQAMDKAQARVEDVFIRLQLQNKLLTDQATQQRDLYKQAVVRNDKLEADLAKLTQSQDLTSNFANFEIDTNIDDGATSLIFEAAETLDETLSGVTDSAGNTDSVLMDLGALGENLGIDLNSGAQDNLTDLQESYAGAAESLNKEPFDETEEIWWYLGSLKERGPFSAIKIREFWQKGKLNKASLLKKTGMDGWGPIDLFPELEIDLEFTPEKTSIINKFLRR